MPVDNKGNKLTGDALKEYESTMALKKEEAELDAKLAEVKEQIRIQNNALELETGMNYDEYKAHMEEAKETKPPEVYDQIDKLQSISSELEMKLNGLRM